MAEHHIKLNIGSKAELTAFDKVKSAVRGLGQSLKSSLAGIGQNLMNIKAGFEMLGGAVKSVFSIFKKALDAETMTVQFKSLMGSMDEARQHMEMLKELGATPPFSMEEFAAASRQMMVMSEGALGMRGSLELVGDAAAATGRPIEEVGEAVARAYSMIRDGQPISRAANQLRNMGLITPKVAASLDELQKSGASSIEIWDNLEEALSKYKGAMEDTEQTGNGMIGAIQSQWDEGLRDFGTALLDFGKVYIKEFLDWMRKIREDGSLQEFIDKFAAFTKYIIDGVGKCISAFKQFRSWLTENLQIAGDVVGAMAGGASFDEAVDWAQKNMGQREKERQMDAEIEAEKKLAAQKLADEKRLEAEKEKNAEKEKQRQALREQIREREIKKAKDAAEKEHQEGLKQQQREDKWREEQQKEEKKARIKKMKEDAEAQIKQQKDTKDTIEKKIDNLDDRVEMLKDSEKEVADKIKNYEDARRNDPNSQVTGDARKAARNAQQAAEAEAVKQNNREKAREHRMENLAKMNPKMLSKKQAEELQKWQNFNDHKKKLKEIREQIRKDEQEMKEYQKKMKKIPDRIKSIQDNLDKFIKQNEVA